MLTTILQWLVKHPVVYDAVQTAVGARKVERVLRDELAALELSGCVLDVGGGTGAWKALFPAHVRHVCLDIDPLKLGGFMRKFADGVAVLADATAMPFEDGSLETVWCVFVAHHLDDDALRGMLDEAARVLKPGGRLLFADALFIPSRMAGRLLWRYDRGNHPRTLAMHRAAVARRFEITRERRFEAVHAYALLVARKPLAS
jgi:ubiquinone/menaquinone biosynthesis C-methylase UbiE